MIVAYDHSIGLPNLEEQDREMKLFLTEPVETFIREDTLKER